MLGPLRSEVAAGAFTASLASFIVERSDQTGGSSRGGAPAYRTVNSAFFSENRLPLFRIRL